MLDTLVNRLALYLLSALDFFVGFRDKYHLHLVPYVCIEYLLISFVY